MPLRSTMHMAAENGDHPSGMLQSLAQPRYHLSRFEMEPIRPHQHLKRGVVRENRNGLGGLGIDQVKQTSHPLRAKISLVAAGAQSIQRNQP